MNRTIGLEYVNTLLTIDAIPNIIITTLYLILGITGNSFVIYVYAFNTKGNINNKYFILVLGIMDLIACTVNCIFTIVLDLMQVDFTSPTFCKILRVSCHVTTLSSAFILLMIAIQRYLLVCRPFGRQMTATWRRNCVIISVFLSCVLGLPTLMFYGTAPTSPRGYNISGSACKYEEKYIESEELSLYNAVLMLACVSGIVTMCVLYALVVRKIYKQRKKFSKSYQRNDSKKSLEMVKELSLTESSVVNALSEKGLKGSISQTSFSNFSRSFRVDKAKESLKYHRFSIMFITITFVCIFAFIPLRTLEFLEVNDRHFVQRTFGSSMPVYRFLYTTYIVNNVVNPFIYGLFDADFRKNIRSILFKNC